MEIIRILLLPLAVIYRVIMALRNMLFDVHLFSSTYFNIPVISVGNLSTGGTGKTPHVEYLLRLLQPGFSLATLSRGYGRTTKGFRIAGEKDKTPEVGDEPLQYFKKFPGIVVAVDESRRHGITQLLDLNPVPDVILLDDAFQHRWVKPGLSLLLTDYQKLYSDDYLLPAGSLREPISGAKRADIIIVTKSPKVLSPIISREIVAKLKPKADQQILFSYIRHGDWTPFGGGSAQSPPSKRVNTIMLVAGIANSYPLQEHLRQNCEELVTISFPDHHRYSRKDMDLIQTSFEKIVSRNRIIITTEKDAMRLLCQQYEKWVSLLPWYYIPIEIEFHKENKEQFNKLILNYVTESTGNSRLHQGKN
ncbi:MAG: tetraacyldisaccharide 4'-kinase [Bacteroidales bacterium]